MIKSSNFYIPSPSLSTMAHKQQQQQQQQQTPHQFQSELYPLRQLHPLRQQQPLQQSFQQQLLQQLDDRAQQQPQQPQQQQLQQQQPQQPQDDTFPFQFSSDGKIIKNSNNSRNKKTKGGGKGKKQHNVTAGDDNIDNVGIIIPGINNNSKSSSKSKKGAKKKNPGSGSNTARTSKKGNTPLLQLNGEKSKSKKTGSNNGTKVPKKNATKSCGGGSTSKKSSKSKKNNNNNDNIVLDNFVDAEQNLSDLLSGQYINPYDVDVSSDGDRSSNSSSSSSINSSSSDAIPSDLFSESDTISSIFDSVSTNNSNSNSSSKSKNSKSNSTSKSRETSTSDEEDDDFSSFSSSSGSRSSNNNHSSNGGSNSSSNNESESDNDTQQPLPGTLQSLLYGVNGGNSGAQKKSKRGKGSKKKQNTPSALDSLLAGVSDENDNDSSSKKGGKKSTKKGSSNRNVGGSKKSRKHPLDKPLKIKNFNELQQMASNNENFVWYFYMEGCPHCREFDPLYNLLAREIHATNTLPGATPIIMAKMEGPPIASRVNTLQPGLLQSYPTIIFKRGDGYLEKFDPEQYGGRSFFSILSAMADFFDDASLRPEHVNVSEIAQSPNPDFVVYLDEDTDYIPRFVNDNLKVRNSSVRNGGVQLNPHYVDGVDASHQIDLFLKQNPTLLQRAFGVNLNALHRGDVPTPTIYDVGRDQSFSLRNAVHWLIQYANESGISPYNNSGNRIGGDVGVGGGGGGESGMLSLDVLNSNGNDFTQPLSRQQQLSGLQLTSHHHHHDNFNNGLDSTQFGFVHNDNNGSADAFVDQSNQNDHAGLFQSFLGGLDSNQQQQQQQPSSQSPLLFGALNQPIVAGNGQSGVNTLQMDHSTEFSTLPNNNTLDYNAILNNDINSHNNVGFGQSFYL